MEDGKETNVTNEEIISNESLFSGFKIADETVSETKKVSEPEEKNVEPIQSTPNQEDGSEIIDVNLFNGFSVSPEESNTPVNVSSPQEANMASEPQPVASESSIDPIPVPMPEEQTIDIIEDEIIPPVNGAEMKPLEEPGINIEPTSTPAHDSSDDKNNSGNHGDKKGVDMFIVILFVILAVFIFYIPKISDFMKSGSKKKGIPTPVPTVTATPSPTANPKKETYTKLSCTPTIELDANATEFPAIYKQTGIQNTISRSIIYYSSDDKIKKLDRITTIDYSKVDQTNQDLFDQQKNRCSNLSKKPVKENGYKLTCKQDKNKFVETETFDLTVTDQPITLKIDDIVTTVNSDHKKDDNVQTMKELQESTGATCKIMK